MKVSVKFPLHGRFRMNLSTKAKNISGVKRLCLTEVYSTLVKYNQCSIINAAFWLLELQVGYML